MKKSKQMSKGPKREEGKTRNSDEKQTKVADLYLTKGNTNYCVNEKEN